MWKDSKEESKEEYVERGSGKCGKKRCKENIERGSEKCEKMRGNYGKRDMSKDARDPSFVVWYLTITAHWAHNPPSIMLPHVLQMICYTLSV